MGCNRLRIILFLAATLLTGLSSSTFATDCDLTKLERLVLQRLSDFEVNDGTRLAHAYIRAGQLAQARAVAYRTYHRWLANQPLDLTAIPQTLVDAMAALQMVDYQEGPLYADLQAYATDTSRVEVKGFAEAVILPGEDVLVRHSDRSLRILDGATLTEKAVFPSSSAGHPDYLHGAFGKGFLAIGRNDPQDPNSSLTIVGHAGPVTLFTRRASGLVQPIFHGRGLAVEGRLVSSNRRARGNLALHLLNEEGQVTGSFPLPSEEKLTEIAADPLSGGVLVELEKRNKNTASPFRTRWIFVNPDGTQRWERSCDESGDTLLEAPTVLDRNRVLWVETQGPTDQGEFWVNAKVLDADTGLDLVSLTPFSIPNRNSYEVEVLNDGASLVFRKGPNRFTVFDLNRPPAAPGLSLLRVRSVHLMNSGPDREVNLVVPYGRDSFALSEQGGKVQLFNSLGVHFTDALESSSAVVEDVSPLRDLLAVGNYTGIQIRSKDGSKRGLEIQGSTDSFNGIRQSRWLRPNLLAVAYNDRIQANRHTEWFDGSGKRINELAYPLENYSGNACEPVFLPDGSSVVPRSARVNGEVQHSLVLVSPTGAPRGRIFFPTRMTVQNLSAFPDGRLLVELRDGMQGFVRILTPN